MNNVGHLHIDRIFIVSNTTATDAMETVEEDSATFHHLGELPYTLDGSAQGGIDQV